MRFERSGRPPRRVSLTPLIDVVFLLLIFFMLASRFLDVGAVALDTADGGAADAADEAVIQVDLRDDGRIELAGEAVARETLGEAVRARLAGRAEPSVLVVPDATVSVDLLVSVLEEVRRAGAAQVTVARRQAAAGA